jgi:hypothetical protein
VSSAISFTQGIEASSVSFSGARIVAITFQPLLANNLAAARPRPDELPVMKIVCCEVLIELFLHLLAKTMPAKFVPFQASQAAGRGTIRGRSAGLAAGRFSRITLAFGFFFPPFCFMSSNLTVIERHVQQDISIRPIALRYQYGITASQIFRGHR